MKLIVAPVMVSILFLTGCDQNTKEMAGDADLNARSALIRISELEKRVLELEKKQPEARATPQAIPQAIQTPEKSRYMLIGPRTLIGSGTEFPTLQRCENARASIIEQAAERAERERAQGIIALGEPQVSCMPL